MLIDTHLHWDAEEYDADREDLLAAARAAGIGLFVVPGVVPGLFARQAEKCRDVPEARLAWGVHPLYVHEVQRHAEALAGAPPDAPGACAAAMAQLESWIAAHPTVAIGEIGLDRFVASPSLEAQRPWFEAQLRLAQQLGLPVILHVRRAVEDVLQSLAKHRVAGGILHAFNGSFAQAERALRLGFALGFGGTMSYEGSRHVRRLAAELPWEAIVLETDGPDIPPVWAQDRRTMPADLARYAELLAELRGCTVAEVIERTGENARRVLRL